MTGEIRVRSWIKSPTLSSPLAGPGSRFGPQLQPAGAGKALGVGLGRGDE
eukprot:COSAG06_NODE_15563_length_1061_cov_7.240125_2_plen_49_part_01